MRLLLPLTWPLRGHCCYVLFSPLLGEVNRSPLGFRVRWTISVFWRTCRTSSLGSIQNQHFCGLWDRQVFLPWKMNGTHQARQNLFKGFSYSFPLGPL